MRRSYAVIVLLLRRILVFVSAKWRLRFGETPTSFRRNGDALSVWGKFLYDIRQFPSQNDAFPISTLCKLISEYINDYE